MKIPFISNILHPAQRHQAPASDVENQSVPPVVTAIAEPPPAPSLENRSPTPPAAPAAPAFDAPAPPAPVNTVSQSPELSDMQVRQAYRKLLADKRTQELRAQLEAEKIRAANREQMRLWREERDRLEAANRAAQEAARIAQEQAQIAERNRPRTWEERFACIRIGPNDAAMPMALPAGIIRHAKLEGCIAELRAKMEPFAAQFDADLKELESISDSAVNATFRQIMAENLAAIEASRFDDVKDAPDRNQLAKKFEEKRIVCRWKLKKSSESALPVIMECAERIQAAARELASEFEARERTAATEFGLPYTPSNVVRHLAEVGFGFVAMTRTQWFPGMMSSPRTFMGGLLDASKQL